MSDRETVLCDRMNAIADQVRPVDLYDRVLQTSGAIRRRRMLAAGALGALGVAITATVVWAAITVPEPAPHEPIQSPAPTPTSTPPPPTMPARFYLTRPVFADDTPGADGWRGIYLLERGNLRKVSDIATTAEPIVSPDMTRLAWITPTGTLAIANLGGSARRILPERWCDYPAWSADSATVYAARLLDDGTLSLQTIDPATGRAEEELAIVGAGNCEVAISESGLTLAYLNTGRELHVASLDPAVQPATWVVPPNWFANDGDRFDLIVSAVSDDGRHVLVNSIWRETTDPNVDYAPGAYRYRIDMKAGAPVYALYQEGAHAYGFFLSNGSMLSRERGVGPSGDLYRVFRLGEESYAIANPYLYAPGAAADLALVSFGY